VTTAHFIATGVFEPLYFTPGKVYAGELVRPDLKVWRVKDDMGHERIILPDTPSPHLIVRTDHPNARSMNHTQVCSGVFKFHTPSPTT
jgi:hypothetical protein